MAPLADQRASRLAAPLGLALAGLTAVTALHFRDPHVQGSWGFCPFNLVTGLDCPGCGGLRAVHNLSDLDVFGAASSNLLVVGLIPLVAVLWLRWTRIAWTGERRRPLEVTPVVTCLLLGAFAVFGVLRNLPMGSWLAA
ncbi:MAG: DUF2752 domain-containing protein [Nocardioides sp.]|nr:DUF2752 domain-containing protein [Nocardioides sp.]